MWMAGYLRSFLAFLNSDRRGQQSLEGHVVRSAKPKAVAQGGEQPVGCVRFDFCMALEARPCGVEVDLGAQVVAVDEFEVGPEEADAEALPWRHRHCIITKHGQKPPQ